MSTTKASNKLKESLAYYLMPKPIILRTISQVNKIIKVMFALSVVSLSHLGES